VTTPRGSGRGPLFAILLAAIAITIVVAIVVSGWPPNPVPPHPSASPSPTTSPAPTAQADCRAEVQPLPPMLSSDPCPSAILAVELAVAPVRLPIERIVVEPGPFSCGVLWPGVSSPAFCFDVFIRPGQSMHAWVAFTGSPKVAAVILGLDLPDNVDQPGATRPPWRTTLYAVEIPPDGWVMP
jgi:hypothetical protein